MEKDFLEAYDAFSEPLFRYCYFKIGDTDLAKDMVQDIFVKSWDYLLGGNDIDNFRAFLYRIAHNVVVDWYRKKKSLSLEALSENGFDPVDQSSDSAQKAEIEQAMKILSKLEQGDQDLITWRYVEDMSIKEIAAILSESENTISVRLHRALQKLRNLLQ